MKNFIEIYENVIPKEICQYFINFFDTQHQLGNTHPGYTGSNSLINKKLKDCMDLDVLNQQLNFHKDEHHLNMVEAYLSLTFNKFLDYMKTYFDGTENKYIDIINNNKPLFKRPNVALMHVYEPPQQGYHRWHCDWQSDAKRLATRMLVGMVYLNDVEEGGETEFYHQKVKIKPKQGTLVVWPAYFTHLHRGNPPISNRKYIINLWAHPIF